MSDTEKQIYIQKDVAFYSACIDAWIQTRMEKDKQLLTLSSVAIGFLLNFHKELDGNSTALIYWILSNISFLITIFLVLFIFPMNATYIEKEVMPQKDGCLGNVIQIFTVASSCFFFLGVVFLCVLAIVLLDFSIITWGNN